MLDQQIINATYGLGKQIARTEEIRVLELDQVLKMVSKYDLRQLNKLLFCRST
jgi:hypothetical protein